MVAGKSLEAYRHKICNTCCPLLHSMQYQRAIYSGRLSEKSLELAAGNHLRTSTTSRGALKALADIFARETMKNHISGWSVLVVSDREISSDAHRLKQAQRLTHVQLLFSMSENCFPRTFFRVPCGYVHFLQSPAVDRMDRCICCLRGSFK